MIIFSIFVIVLIISVLVEKGIKDWRVRSACNILLVIIVGIFAINVGLRVGRSMEQIRYSLVLPHIFSIILDSKPSEKDELLLKVKKQLSRGKLSEIEDLVDALESKEQKLVPLSD